jgi:MFS transporter, DHA3 family, tetracycline resistance protein
LLFEVPTGIVADTYSRRLSVIIGMFILGVAFILVGAVPIFAWVLVGQVVSGIGYTFLSGALDAWLADEIGEVNIRKIYLRSGQFNRIIGIAGTLTSVALASIALNLPILIGGGLYVMLGGYLVVSMPENGFKPITPTDRTSWGTMLGIARDGIRIIRSRPALLMLLVVSAIAGAASEGYDRLGVAHLLANFVFPSLGVLKPVVWFGLINIAVDLFSLLTIELLRRRMEKSSQNTTTTVRVLLVLNTLIVVSVVTFGLAINFPLAVLALLVRGTLGALFWPLYNAWLIQLIDPQVRATMLSIFSQSNALGQIVGGPGVGWVGKRFSLRAAIVVSGLLLSPASWLYARISNLTISIN